MVQMILDLGQIPAGFWGSFFAGGAAGCAKICKDRGQILVYQEQIFDIGCFRDGQKRLDTAGYGRSQGERKTPAVFSKDRRKCRQRIPTDEKNLKFQGSTTDCREKFCLQSKQITCLSSAEISLPPGVVILPLPMVVRRSRWQSMEEKRNARGESVWILPPPRRYKK